MPVGCSRPSPVWSFYVADELRCRSHRVILSLSAISGLIAWHSARLASAVPCGGLGRADVGVGADGCAVGVGRVRSMMPTTKAAVATMIAAATAAMRPLLRRAGGG